MRATATDTSYIGTNRAAWQAGYVPSTEYATAVERIGDFIGGHNHLNEFSLAQLNNIEARLEVLDAMGFDLSRVHKQTDDPRFILAVVK
jgi:hypothetical protein